MKTMIGTMEKVKTSCCNGGVEESVHETADWVTLTSSEHNNEVDLMEWVDTARIAWHKVFGFW